MDIGEQIQKLNELDLSDIDFSRAGMWPAPAKIALLIVISVLVAFAGYYFIVSPKLAELDSSQTREATLRTQYEKRAHQASNIEGYRAQNEELVLRFDALLKQLPSDTEVPGLLEDITQVGVDGGLQIEKIELKREVTQEFFIELPMSIRLTGSYHNFGAFVSGVSALPRIVTLHDFSVSPDKGDETLSLVIDAKTYRYRE